MKYSLDPLPYPLKRLHRNLSSVSVALPEYVCLMQANFATAIRGETLFKTFDLTNFTIDSKKSYRLM